MTIYNEEVMRRHEFTSIFEGHFLSTLFPGMNDMPPAFATEAPSIFDSSLPQLSQDGKEVHVLFLVTYCYNIYFSDINLLSIHLPEITSKIQLPDLGAVIEFFSLK